jgi:hypothetical protein
MKHVLMAALVVVLQGSVAAEPLAGLWRLTLQEIDGQRRDVEPLTLRIVQRGERLSFAFSVPVNDIHMVTVSYSLLVDGADADILDSNQRKIGTIQVRRGGPRRYTLLMKGPNRPDSQGTLTVSADGKTLVSESVSVQGGKQVIAKQTFRRN